jgi:hypothetical protein
MLSSAIYLREPLDALVMIDKHNTSAKTALRRLKLSKKEWEILVDLEPLLAVRNQIH